MIRKPQLLKNVWTLAFEFLGIKDQGWPQKYHSDKQKKPIDVAFRAVQGKQKACLRKRWTLKTSAGRIIVRKILDEIAFWINKFKEGFGVVTQFDPSQMSLPWTGVRFLLQVSISYIQTFVSVVEGLECGLILDKKNIIGSIHNTCFTTRICFNGQVQQALIALYQPPRIPMPNGGNSRQRKRNIKLIH